MRWRSVIHVLSVELFGRSTTLPAFPVRKDLSGLGLTDWTGYASHLAEKFTYQNTFLDREPRLDILRMGPEWEGTQDFVIASDVFEHVAPPVSRAFQNLRRLLKPDGIAIVTVPYGPIGETVEHFPNLHRYEVQAVKGRRRLVNTTKDGAVEIFDDIRFHGCESLVMRHFSEGGVTSELRAAGFCSVQVYADSYLAHGVYFPHRRSLPIAARAA